MTSMPATFIPVTQDQDTIQSVSDEIQRLVAERQELRATGAPAEELEENRRRIARAQSHYSHLLIRHYLPRSEAA
jgi:DNA helicase HerA-like ATPase